MTARFFVASAALLASLGTAVAGMPDAYRVAPPPTPARAEVQPYALTGNAEVTRPPHATWTWRVQHVGTMVVRVVFVR
jgi:hypothetical protein